MEQQSPWKLGGLTWTELGKRVYAEINDDDVFGRAAQLAYYFLLALFPLLLFMLSLLGYFAGEDGKLRDELFAYLGKVVPGDAFGLVRDTVNSVDKGKSGGKLSFGILAALWAASNGMGAICDSLNVAYEVKESRPWWKARLTAIGLTIALAVLIIAALVLVLYGHDIAGSVASKFSLGNAFEWSWKILQWPIVLAFVLLAFGLVYYFAPNLKKRSWKWVTPGSFIAVLLWLVVSLGFSLYLSYFNTYNATYGSLGAVIILMLWFYLTGAAILIGGEVNSEIENAAAKAGAPDAKEAGEKQPGEKQGSNDARRGKSATTQKITRAKASTNRITQPLSTNNLANAARRVKSGSSDRSLTVRKVAVVFGAWLVSKLTGARSNRRPR